MYVSALKHLEDRERKVRTEGRGKKHKMKNASGGIMSGWSLLPPPTHARRALCGRRSSDRGYAQTGARGDGWGLTCLQSVVRITRRLPTRSP